MKDQSKNIGIQYSLLYHSAVWRVNIALCTGIFKVRPIVIQSEDWYYTETGETQIVLHMFELELAVKFFTIN